MKSFLRSLVFLFLVTATEAFACVGCREPGSQTVANEPQTVLAGIGFSWSVIFMLVFSLTIVVGMSCYIWFTCRRLARERGE